MIETYPELFKYYWLSGMRRKLGLFTSETEDEALIQSLLDIMQENEADFTMTFRKLCYAARGSGQEGSLRDLFKDSKSYKKWALNWRARMSREIKTPDDHFELMRQANPAIIPRNHRVEQALASAVDDGDFGPFETFLELLSSPYVEPKSHTEYLAPPKPEENVLHTFCGT